MRVVLADPPSTGHDRQVAGTIFSVGYEGFSVAALLESLQANKVSSLIDVRLTPASRRPGFSRKSLSAALEAVGIDYVHEPELGNPVENRDSFRKGDGVGGRRRMRELLENGSQGALLRLVERAADDRVAVLCVERDRSRCHREVVTEMAQEVAPDLEVVHIL